MTFEMFKNRLNYLMDKFSCEYEDEDKVKSSDYMIQDIVEAIEDLEEEDE